MKNTVQQKHAAFTAAKTKIEPPSFVQLNAEQRTYFDVIVDAKHVDLWSEPQILTACDLARTFATCDRLREIIERDGEILTTPTTTKPHPAFVLLDRAIQQSITLSRFLQIHSQAVNGRSDANANRNRLHSKTKQVVDSILLDDDDDLLAR